MKIYGDVISGNCQKVKFTADFLGLDYEWIPIDVVGGEARSPNFLTVNPQGEVPAVVLSDGRMLAQSNAIISYLAADTPLVPQDRYLRAKVDEFLFWEQYSHEPYVAVCRFQMLYLGKTAAEREEWRVIRGEAALDYLEGELTHRQWLAGTDITIADIAILAYTRMAADGGFDLSRRTALRRWIADCERCLRIASE
jgi:glutathione S-transferase